MKDALLLKKGLFPYSLCSAQELAQHRNTTYRTLALQANLDNSLLWRGLSCAFTV